MSWNQILLNSIFGFCCLYIILVSNLKEWKIKSHITGLGIQKSSPGVRKSVLENSKIYHLKEDKPHIYMASKLTTIQVSNNDTAIDSLTGRSYSDGQKPINFSSQSAFFQRHKNKLILQDHVVISDDDTTLNADNVTYFLKKEEILGNGNVLLKGKIPNSEDKINITANRFSHSPRLKISKFHEDVEGYIHRKEKYREGLDFKANNLEFSRPESKINLIGSVHLNKAPYSARSRSGEIYLNNYSNKLNYFVLNDDVKLREKMENGPRKAFAEKMEGIASEGKLILTGLPKVVQRGEVIKGNKITIRENSEVVEVDNAYTTFKIKKGQ